MAKGSTSFGAELRNTLRCLGVGPAIAPVYAFKLHKGQREHMPSKLFETLRQLSANNPFLKFMGMELLDADEGWVKMKIVFRPEFLQPFTIHGGVIYSLADAAAAHALLT